ncbi:MAG: helix-turn-helix transcriptional regulator [Sterolibacterium sp.]|jgi:ribosome-binding protein aMBF1 (putative translation factor)
MSARPQIIFDEGKPAFAVIPYEEYVALTANKTRKARSKEDEFVPFILSDYIKNPIRVARVDAGLTQKELAKRLKVTQGYVSKIEGRGFEVSPTLMDRVAKAIRRKV